MKSNLIDIAEFIVVCAVIVTIVFLFFKMAELEQQIKANDQSAASAIIGSSSRNSIQDINLWLLNLNEEQRINFANRLNDIPCLSKYPIQSVGFAERLVTIGLYGYTVSIDAGTNIISCNNGTQIDCNLLCS